MGDKAYISQAVQAELQEANRVQVVALPRRNQAAQVPPAVRRTVNWTRQMWKRCTGN